MKKKILVADDSITIQKVIQLSFPENEYEVVCSGDGNDALKKMESFSPDIILADVIMPESDGYALCKAIKSSPSFSHIPVLMLVGTFEPFDEEKAGDSGADGIITKPFDRSMLVEKVKQALQPELEKEEMANKEIGKSSRQEESSLEDFPISLDKDNVIDLSKPSRTAERRSDAEVDEEKERIESEETVIQRTEEKQHESENMRFTQAEIEAIAKKLMEFMPKNFLGDIIKASITEVAEKIIKEKIKELEEKASE